MSFRVPMAFAAASILACMMGAGRAEADDGDLRIVVMSFEGPGAKGIRNELIKFLATAEGVELVARKQATQAGAELGIPADTSKPKNLVKIGEMLDLDAIVVGNVFAEKKLKNLELQVIFTDKPEVSFTKNFTWSTKMPSDDLILEIATETIQGIRDTIKLIDTEKAQAIFAQPPPVQQPPPPKKKKKIPGKGERGHVISIQAGMAMSARKLKIETVTGPGVEYDGSVYPALVADLEFFPIRLATASPASGLGLGLSFRRSFLLESQLQGGPTVYDTSMTGLDARLVYQLILDKAPLALDFSAGWGLLFYRIDGASRDSLPVVSYDYMAFLVGVAAAIQAVRPWLTIDLGATIRIPHMWGIANSTYGADASGIGGTFHLGLSGAIAVGLGWAVGFEYTGFMTKHKGPCEVLSGTCLSATKSSDSHLSGFAKLGYAW